MKRSTDFRFIALPSEYFEHLLDQPAEKLTALKARRYKVDGDGFFCRLTLEDAPTGETVILTNYQHQPAHSPFQSSHAVYVREKAKTKSFDINVVPEGVRKKLLSVRAFDNEDYIVGAEVVVGDAVEPLLEKLELRRENGAYD